MSVQRPKRGSGSKSAVSKEALDALKSVRPSMSKLVGHARTALASRQRWSSRGSDEASGLTRSDQNRVDHVVFATLVATGYMDDLTARVRAAIDTGELSQLRFIRDDRVHPSVWEVSAGGQPLSKRVPAEQLLPAILHHYAQQSVVGLTGKAGPPLANGRPPPPYSDVAKEAAAQWGPELTKTGDRVLGDSMVRPTSLQAWTVAMALQFVEEALTQQDGRAPTAAEVAQVMRSSTSWFEMQAGINALVPALVVVRSRWEAGDVFDDKPEYLAIKSHAREWAKSGMADVLNPKHVRVITDREGVRRLESIEQLRSDQSSVLVRCPLQNSRDIPRFIHLVVDAYEALRHAQDALS